MLIPGLRALRSVHHRLPAAAPAALSVGWRGLAGDGGSGAGGGSGGGATGSDSSSCVGSGSLEPPSPQGHSSSSSSSSGGGTGDSDATRSSPAAAAAAAATGGQHLISIDRSGLYNPRPHSHSRAAAAAAVPGFGGSAGEGEKQQQLQQLAVDKEPETELVRHLKALIQFRGGPITLAEYMSEVLTNPQHGYYTQRDVFGTAGDFITSPEISQMFGEMVGIWCVATWQQLGCPSQLHIVELGPGRGTLMADLLRGTAAFKQFSQALRVSMVEVSPHLRGMQWKALRCPGQPPAAADQQQPQQQQAADAATSSSSSRVGDASSSSSSSDEATTTRSSSISSGISSISGWNGAAVSWHRSLEEVEAAAGGGGPALHIAHEFLDALPVHQFQKTERGWCERLIDVASADSPLHLRMVLSPGPTPAARLLLPRRLKQLPAEQAATMQALEVCPQGLALAESLAQRVAEQGGAALIIDYGQDAAYEASLQAIRRHQFVGLLEQPGSADLSNRVDYSALRSTVVDSGAAADCLGPIPQSHFLLGLGIEARLEQLVGNATAEQAKALQAGCRRLVGGSEPGAILTDEGMGHSYQAFCIAQRGLQPWPFSAEADVVEESGDEEEADTKEEEAVKAAGGNVVEAEQEAAVQGQQAAEQGQEAAEQGQREAEQPPAPKG